MYQRMCLFLIFILTACMPSSESTQNTDDLLLSENFSTGRGWSNYNSDAFTVNTADGVYAMLLNQPGQYIWGTTSGQYTNTVIEVDVTWQSDNPDALTGIICRLHPENSRGYYVVISASGDYSMRYIGRNVDDALIRWQSHNRIPRTGSFTMRVLCSGNNISLSINGDFINSARDSRLSSGQIGLTLGLPANASNFALVEFDNLRLWDTTGE